MVAMLSRVGLLIGCLGLVTACSIETTVTTSDGSVGLLTTTVTIAPAASTVPAPNKTTTTTTATTTTTEPEVAPLPWTYEGTIRREQTYTASFGAAGSHTAVNDDHIVITLSADGTAEGVYTRGGNGSVFECSDPAKAGQIYPGSGEETVTPINWTHRDGVLMRSSDGAEMGVYDAEALRLTWSYTSSITPEGCFDGTFTLEEGWVEAIVPRTSP
jgi:hypothetical protein